MLSGIRAGKRVLIPRGSEETGGKRMNPSAAKLHELLTDAIRLLQVSWRSRAQERLEQARVLLEKAMQLNIPDSGQTPKGGPGV